MKKLRLITHLLYRLVQHCPPDRCLHSVGQNSEQNSWCMFRSAFSAANSPANCWGVAPVYVQREDAAIFATDCSGTSLELGSVVLPDCTMASYEILDGGNKRIASVGIEKVAV